MASNFPAHSVDTYDRFMGRWSERLAVPFLDFAGLRAGDSVADIGCGTGNLTMALLGRTEPRAIAALDYDANYVARLAARTEDPRVEVRQGDATALPYADGGFDRALSLLVLHHVSDAARAVAEMRRVTCPGGTVAAAVWFEYGGMPMQRLFYDALALIEPAEARRRDAFAFRPATAPGELAGLMAAAGLQDIAETMVPIRMDYADFADYAGPMIGPAGTQAALMASLGAPARERLAAALQDGYLCGRPDGPRTFAAVAWVVKGRVPG
jgi:SAM-dependent methyltransferase